MPLQVIAFLDPAGQPVAVSTANPLPRGTGTTYANIVDHGGDPAGVNDNVAALQAALAAASTVYFPAGTYMFAARRVVVGEAAE